MRGLIGILCVFSLLWAQTVIVPIPGQRQGGGGDSGPQTGTIVGIAVGVGLLILITKSLMAKQAPSDKSAPAVPFQFILVSESPPPADLQILDTQTFRGLHFSLIKWEKTPKDLGKKLTGKVLFFQPNYIYTLAGEVQSLKPEGFQVSKGPLVAVLDTGADLRLLKDVPLLVKNFRKDPYKPEDHATAVVYILYKEAKTPLLLYRVCSEGRCDSWSILKALVDAILRDIKVINLSFGTPARDRAVELLLKFALKKGIKVVAPVGNKPSERLPFPARLRGVIAVAGKPCFPQKICTKADALEPYIFETPFGTFKGTSFASAFHAGKITRKLLNRPSGIIHLQGEGNLGEDKKLDF